MGKREWAKLSYDWYRDDVLVAIAQEHPGVLALWPILVAQSKHASSGKHNPEGIVETSLRKLSTDSFISVGDIEPILDLMVDGELISVEVVEKKITKVLMIRLLRFGKWQVARGTKADRDLKYRENKKAESFAGVLSDNATLDRHHNDGSATQIEKEIEKENNYPTDVGLSSNDVTSTAAAQKDQIGKQIREVYEHWLQAVGRNPNRNKLTKERRNKIRARFMDGYSIEQLKRAIDHWAADPFHRGDNPDGKVYDDLVTFFRNETKVEKALTADEASGVKLETAEERARRLSSATAADNKPVADGWTPEDFV